MLKGSPFAAVTNAPLDCHLPSFFSGSIVVSQLAPFSKPPVRVARCARCSTRSHPLHRVSLYPPEFRTSFFAFVHRHLPLRLKSDQLGEIAKMAFCCLRNSTPLGGRRHENRIQNRRWNQTECKKAYRRPL